MDRAEITEKIVEAKLASGKTWAAIAQEMGMAKEWATCALMGQMQMSREQVDKASKALGLKLSEVEIAMLMTPPYRGGLGESVPTDALLYRFYEVIQVYGPAMKALIEEEFGDGIMSAIDFSMDISRQEDPKGDRVVVTYNGKFLPYKSF